MEAAGFLDERRLLQGPWQAFEKDVARLLLANGFEDVRIVGGSGDMGADVLGVKGNNLWVFQCKHTTSATPSRKAIDEVVQAGRAYRADRLVVATSRPPGDSFHEEIARHRRAGRTIDVAPPSMLLDMMKKTPEFPPQRRTLRPYQEEASQQMRDALLATGRAQVVLATGLGKTVVMADLVADMLSDNLVPGGRVLVLAHTRDLVDQLQRAFWYQLPKWVATHKLDSTERPIHHDGVTFATVQSALARIEDMPDFGLILVDEAHHIGAAQFQRALAQLNPPMVAGVTATPWRGDGYELDDLLGAPLVRLGISEGLQQGFLSDVDYRLLADNIDWTLVQERSQFSYSLKELNRRLILPTRDEEAARLIKSTWHERSRRAGIVFSPTIEHAKSFASMLGHYGFKAEAISSELAPRERAILMARFRAGLLDFLTTVDLFNEGVDVPDVDVLVFLRATHSRRIFVQQLGRGLRVSPNKDKVIVLDFVSDLRRMSEVIELDRAVRGGDLERLGLGAHLVEFSDRSAGSFLREWMLDQADLFQREGEHDLEVPQFDYPRPPPPGGIE